TLVATTTTASGGEYYFNQANVTQNGANGILPGVCGAGGAPAYEVQIPNISGSSKQPALLGLSPTLLEATSGNNSDLRDSNGIISTPVVDPVASAAIACAALAGPGDNDHSVDFGFSPAPLVADDQTLSVDEDNPITITLSASDEDD